MENFDLTNVYDHNDSAKATDPWLGNMIYTIRKNSDKSSDWNRLLGKSVHFNHLVDLGKNWKVDPTKLKDFCGSDLLVINMSADPFRKWEQAVVDTVGQYTDNFVILSGDVHFYLQPQPHICYFPFFYLNQKYSYQAIQDIDQPRTYKLSCLNKTARYHRIENFIKLKKKSYFDSLLFGMHFYYDKNQAKRDVGQQHYDTDIVRKFESLIPQVLPEFKEDPHCVDHPAYSDSYCAYVTETSTWDNTMFVSEKTWRPFMSGQFGLWLSNPGLVNHLRSLGFDVFDDVMMNHDYDHETNLNRRIDMLHSVIDQYMQQDQFQIWQDTLDRRRKNIDLFYSQDLENLLTTQCKEYLL